MTAYGTMTGHSSSHDRRLAVLLRRLTVGAAGRRQAERKWGLDVPQAARGRRAGRASGRVPRRPAHTRLTVDPAALICLSMAGRQPVQEGRVCRESERMRQRERDQWVSCQRQRKKLRGHVSGPLFIWICWSACGASPPSWRVVCVHLPRDQHRRSISQSRRPTQHWWTCLLSSEVQSSNFAVLFRCMGFAQRLRQQRGSGALVSLRTRASSCGRASNTRTRYIRIVRFVSSWLAG